MTDLTTLLEVGGPLAALGGGAAYTRAKHPAAYWSTVGLPTSPPRPSDCGTPGVSTPST